MLNPSQCELIGYMEDGDIYHSHCAYKLDEDLWDRLVEKLGEEQERAWDDNVPSRFADARNGSLLIRYSIDEMELNNIDGEVEALMDGTSFYDLPEIVREDVLEQTADTFLVGNGMLDVDNAVKQSLYDNAEELGLGFVVCDMCTERIGG